MGAVGPVMVTVAALEVVEAKSVSPVKVAVMALEPSGKVVRLRAAVPLFSVAMPSVVPPLVKVMVLPLVVRVPALYGERVAVSATGLPRDAEVGEAARCNVGAMFATVTVAALEVAEAKFASPVKVAVMVLLPTGSVDVLKTAVPLFNVAVPNTAPPLVKVTDLPFAEMLPLV